MLIITQRETGEHKMADNRQRQEVNLKVRGRVKWKKTKHMNNQQEAKEALSPGRGTDNAVHLPSVYRLPFVTR